ncbi:MAG: VF530 family DNA-binding protein [Formosimonas sp.]
MNSPQKNNPLHGFTLEFILTELVAHYGWDGLNQQIPLKCFAIDPSIKSALKLLRKTPWAREKVESLYGVMLREVKREANKVSPYQPSYLKSK